MMLFFGVEGNRFSDGHGEEAERDGSGNAGARQSAEPGEVEALSRQEASGQSWLEAGLIMNTWNSIGQVYFVEAIGADVIKIGWTRSTNKRLRLLSESSPFELKLLASASGTLGQEKMLHERFSAFHFRNEWFRKNSELDLLISRIANGAAIPIIKRRHIEHRIDRLSIENCERVRHFRAKKREQVSL